MAVAIADGPTTLSATCVSWPISRSSLAKWPRCRRHGGPSRPIDAVGISTHRLGPGQGALRGLRSRVRTGFYIIDLEATLVGAHSEKEGAAPNYKHGFGFSPLIAFLDATGEPLAARLRPGNAAPGNAEDHVIVLDEALAQLPIDPSTGEVIARTDAVGCSHRFTEACVERNVRFVVGHKLSAELAAVVTQMPMKRWQKSISADGTDERESGEVAEITDLVDLSSWSEGTRMIARRELPHPGAQLTFSDIDGYRYQVFITDHQEADVSFLESLYRSRGRCERRICVPKDTEQLHMQSGCLSSHSFLSGRKVASA